MHYYKIMVKLDQGIAYYNYRGNNTADRRTDGRHANVKPWAPPNGGTGIKTECINHENLTTYEQDCIADRVGLSDVDFSSFQRLQYLTLGSKQHAARQRIGVSRYNTVKNNYRTPLVFTV